MLFTLLEEIQALDQRIVEAERQIEAYQKSDSDTRRLSQIPSLGLLMNPDDG